MKSMTDTTFDPTAHPRSAASGRFVEAQHTAPDAGLLVVGDDLLAPIDETALRAADYEAEAVSSRVVAAMFDGRALEPGESEISETAAVLFARDALQNLPEGHTPDEYPLLTEFARTPFSGDTGAPDEKVDALHAELVRFRQGHNDGWALRPLQRARIDHLFTYSLHAVPGQH